MKTQVDTVDTVSHSKMNIQLTLTCNQNTVQPQLYRTSDLLVRKVLIKIVKFILANIIKLLIAF